MLKLVNLLRETIYKKKLVTFNQNILLNFSGGQDSNVLLFCFLILQSQIRFKFKLIWLNHFWQIDSFYITNYLTKSASNFSCPLLCFLPLYNLSFVASHPSCAKRVGLPFEPFTSTFGARCGKHGRAHALPHLLRRKSNTCVGEASPSENIARNWRHIVTDRACAFYQLDKSVLGHTKSDRVETVLFNLIRGTGSKGINVLQWERNYSSFSYNKLYPSLKQMKNSTHINF